MLGRKITEILAVKNYLAADQNVRSALKFFVVEISALFDSPLSAVSKKTVSCTREMRYSTSLAVHFCEAYHRLVFQFLLCQFKCDFVSIHCKQ